MKVVIAIVPFFREFREEYPASYSMLFLDMKHENKIIVGVEIGDQEVHQQIIWDIKNRPFK